VVLFVVTWSVLARAGSADDLQAEGEEAARRGDYANAIDRFKAAERIEPRARHACLIALAYTRRNLWSQAEIFRTACHERANADDPLPDWMADADREIDEAIRAANVAAVTIVVEPVDAAVRLSVSSFAPDETFSPRVIHLSPGTHQIFASAPGFEPAQMLVDVRDRTPQQIHIALTRRGPPSHVAPWLVIGAGVALGAVGGVLHATWYRQRYAAVEADVPGTEAADIASWLTARRLVIGCYVAGAVTIGVGLVLRATVWREAPAIDVAPTGGGAIVSIGWSR
jgi:hypothetical protein